MKLSKKQKILYARAHKTLLFADLYKFVLTLWPESIDTSHRKHVRYQESKGIIIGLDKFDHDNLFEKFDIGNLLECLDYSIKIAVHKSGMIQNKVKLSDLNPEYIQFLFEKKSIGYAIEKNKEKIPPGLRDNIDSIYDISLIKKYFNNQKLADQSNL